MKPLLILALFAASAGAQTFYKVATEGNTITLTSSVTARYGYATGCPAGALDWNPITLPAGTYTVSNGGLFSTDPCYGMVKELDVLETSSAQTVTVNGKPVTVPPIAAPVPPVTPAISKQWSCPVAAYTATVTEFSDGTYSTSIVPVVLANCTETK